MSIILKALYEHLLPLMPVVQYSDEFLQRGGAALGSGSDNGEYAPYPNNLHKNDIKECGPVVEVGWDDGRLNSSVNVGATIIMEAGNGIPTIWVERNSYSGKSHGNLYVEAGDPDSFDKIVEFLS